MSLPITIKDTNTTYPNKQSYLDSYKEWLDEQALTHNTSRAYLSRIKQFLLFREYAHLDNQPLDYPSRLNELMNMYLTFLKDARNVSRSINANINALQSFAQFLGLGGIQLKRERCYHKTTKILDTEEEKRFLQAVLQQESIRDRALALMLLYTGLRIGDCARLNVEDVLNSRIPLNQQLSVALKEWLDERNKLINDRSEKPSALWLTKDGQRLSISGITFIIKRIGWQAQLTVSAEMLRRTYLTKLSHSYNKDELVSQFGGYISASRIKRYGVVIGALVQKV